MHITIIFQAYLDDLYIEHSLPANFVLKLL